MHTNTTGEIKFYIISIDVINYIQTNFFPYQHISKKSVLIINSPDPWGKDLMNF